MPRIPEYVAENNRLDTAANVMPRVRLDDSIGEGISRMGSAISGVAEHYARKQEEMEAFGSQIELMKLQERIQADDIDAQKDLSENGEGWYDNRLENFNKRANETLAALPESQREKAAMRLDLERQKYSNTYATQQIQQRDTWATTNLTKAGESFQARIQAAPDNLDVIQNEYLELLKTSPLSKIQKQNLETTAKTVFGQAAYKAYIDAGNIDKAKEIAGKLDEFERSYNPPPMPPVGSPASTPPRPNDRSLPAPIRHNNPGAMWPGSASKKFGATTSETLRDGQNNKIATFPTPEAGGAALFELLNNGYSNRTLGEAIKKWSGGNNVSSYLSFIKSKTGFDSNTKITKEFLSNPETAIPLAKAMSQHESGKPFPMSDEQWQTAFAMQTGGVQQSATAQTQKTVQVASAQGATTTDATSVDAATAPKQQEKPLVGKHIQEVEKLIKQREQTQKLERQKNIDQLQFDASEGKVTLDDLNARWHKGEFNTFEEYNSVKTQVEKYNIDRQEGINALDGVLGGKQFNQFDDKDKKAADSAFSELVRNNKDNPDAAYQAIDLIQKQTGIIPPSVTVSLRGALAGKDEAAAQKALSLSANIMQRNPRAFDGLDGGKEISEKTVRFQHYVENMGFTAQEAVKRLRELDDPEYKSKIRVTDGDVTELQKKITIDDLASNADESYWLGNPTVAGDVEAQNAVLSDYRELTVENYKKHGDADLAKTEAMKQLKKVYGVSYVNGSSNGVFMRYPIEKTHPPIGGSFDYVTEQAQEAIKAEKNVEVSKDNLFFIPAPRISNDAFQKNKPIPYQLWWKDDDGKWQTMPGKAFVADPKLAQDKIAQQFTESDAKRAEANRDLKPEDIWVPKVMRGGSVQKGIADAVNYNSELKRKSAENLRRAEERQAKLKADGKAQIKNAISSAADNLVRANPVPGVIPGEN